MDAGERPPQQPTAARVQGPGRGQWGGSVRLSGAYHEDLHTIRNRRVVKVRRLL